MPGIRDARKGMENSDDAAMAKVKERAEKYAASRGGMYTREMHAYIHTCTEHTLMQRL